MSACVCTSRKTGFHFPALDGTEAVIEFRDGDPDKPYIAAFHHNSQAVDHITNDRRWLSRNVIRTQSNNKLRMEDWAEQEGIKLSTEHSGKSQLNLGYLVNQTLEYRGEGYELRTSGYGAIRAGKGQYIATYDCPGATGKQLDMQETIAQLESALELAKALADLARSAKAIPADTDAQQQVKNDLDALKQPGILVGAPASIAVASEQDVQVAAQCNLSVTTGKNTDLSVAKRFTVAAGELVSIFAAKLGIKLFAAKGPVEIQAQGDAMSLLADKDVHIASVNGKVNIAAAKELVLECGGAFIQLKGGSVTIGGPLDLFIKTITIQKQGKASMYPRLGPFPPQPVEGPVKFNINFTDMPGPNGVAHANTPWRIVHAPDASETLMATEHILSGRSDPQGKVALSDAQQKQLHEAYNAAPGRTWLAFPGQVRQIRLTREQKDWDENTRLYTALDAMGYSDALFTVHQGGMEQSFTPWAKQELRADTSRAVLSRLRGNG